MFATNYYENMILNLMLGQSATASPKVYIGLFLSPPGESGGGAEVSYQGYSRMEILFSEPGALESGIGFVNTEDITFAKANSDVGSVTHIGIFDSVLGGNMLLYGELDAEIVVSKDEAPVIVAGEAKYWVTGALSVAYATKVLNLLRGISCPGFVPYLALFNGNPETAGAELNGGGYNRLPLTFSAPSELPTGPSQITNSTRVATERATSAWGVWNYTAIFDAASNGTPVWLAERTPKEMRKGLMAIVEVGALAVSVN